MIFIISIIYLIGIIVTSLLSANAFYMMFIPVIIIGILQKLSPTFNTRQMCYLFSVILALSFFINANQSKNQYETLEQKDQVKYDKEELDKLNAEIISDDFVKIEDGVIRHNIKKLAFHIFSRVL